MTSFNPVTHVIFDMDGLLLDTETLYERAGEIVVSKYGKEFSFKIQEAVMGLSARDDARYVTETLSLPLSIDEYLGKLAEVHQQLFPKSELMPDTEQRYFEATQVVAKEYGQEYTWKVKAGCLGMTGQSVAQYIIDALSLPLTVDQYLPKLALQCQTLFPLSKLLPDTERLYTEATQRIASAYGKNYTWEIKVGCMGMKGDMAAKRIIDCLELPLTVDQYLERIASEYDVLFPCAKLLPDTVDSYVTCHNRVLGPLGHSLSWQRIIAEMGHSCIEIARAFCSEFGLGMSAEEYNARVVAFHPVILPQVKLLRDTVESYVVAHNRVLEPLGHSVSWQDVMAEMGHSSMEVAHTFSSRFGLDMSAKEYRKQVASFYPEGFSQTKLMRGAEKLVRHLSKHKIPIAIASGGAQDSYKLKTTNHREFMKLFLHVVLASTDPEVKNGKPAPDVFLICAGRFPDQPKPEKCLVFEDAPNGVEAAVAANMQVIMVPDSRLNPELSKGATQVLSSLEEFKPELFGLPAYD